MANITGTTGNDFLTGTADPDFILALAGNDTLLALGGDDTINGNEGNDSLRGDEQNDYVRGGQDNDFLYGNLGNDTGFGDLGNDTVFGNEGTDLLNGNEGDDVLDGNQGNDTVRGGMDNDLVRGGQDNDELYGDRGDDTVFGDFGDDSIFGNEGMDVLNGNQGQDVLNGNEGDDTVRGGMDNDLVRGGQNNDELYGDLGNDTLFGDLGNDTIFGGEGTDLQFGNDGNDVLNGNEGDDTLFGDEGQDLVRGGMDNDLLYGDLGNDTLFGDLGNDTILGDENDDLINGNEGQDVLNGNEGNDTVRGGMDNDTVRGGMDNDEVYGDLGDDTVYGDLGNDSVFGGDGTDLLFGNEGNDALNGNSGNDTSFGGQGNDTIRGGMDNDSLLGEEGNDTLYGDLGDDTLYGGLDNDLLYGDQGEEFDFGGNGNDVLLGNEGNDTIFGLAGNDRLFGNENDDVLNGNDGQDTVFGGMGDDLLRGGKANDSLFGDRGRDTLFGDLGADTLTGDSGGEINTDIFVFGKGTGGPTRPDADIVTDFQLCIDLISLTGGVSYADLNIFQGTGADTANTIIQDKTTGEFLAVLQNIDSDSIDGSAFIPRGPERVSIVATNPTTIESTPIAAPGLFTISVPCDTDEDLTVNYTISGIAINGTDYETLSGSVIIPAGANSATIPVTAIDDTIVEPDETVIATLSIGTGYDIAAANSTATVTILDNDALTQTTVNIFASDPLASDGTPPDPGQFTIARTGDLSQPLTVNYSLSPVSTATKDTDYTSAPLLTTSITIPAGSDRAVIDINPISDNLIEGNETVTLFLGGGPDYTVGPANNATVIITDPPVVPRPTVFVTAPDPTTSETGPNPGTFQFARTGGDINQPVTIRYTITGTATANGPGTDYTGSPSFGGIITIPAGQTVTPLINITPTQDGINEPTETVTVTVAEDLAYFVGSQSTATVSIQDGNPLTGTLGNAGPILRYSSGGAFQGNHPNFTQAVAAASPNDILVAQAGTYSEPGTVLINKPLTLRGPNAGISPSSGFAVAPAIVSAPANQPVFTIQIGTNNVTIEGLRIQMNGDNAIRYQDNAADNIVIRQNDFTGTGPFNGGVIFLDFLGAANSSASIIDNLIREVTTAGSSTTSAIQTFRIDRVTITDNTIANLTGPGIAADAITNSASVINRNSVSNTGEQGIQLAGGNATIANNDITNTNTNSGTDRGGIRLRDSGLTTSTLGTVNVLSNVITNSFNGVAIRDTTNIAGTLNVNFNNLIGNSNAALYHGGTGTINASNNWWDSPTGPVVGGTGRNAINGTGANSVTFSPFATQPL